MRVNETLSLDQPDVDFERGILHIQQTKFGKSRYVPVHPSTVDCIEKVCPSSRSSLLHTIDFRLLHLRAWEPDYRKYGAIHLRQVVPTTRPARAGQISRSRSTAAGLRHRFAVRTLIHWYRAELDVERELPKLATYLGHAHVNESYWYLEAVPELLQLATDRLIAREV